MVSLSNAAGRTIPTRRPSLGGMAVVQLRCVLTAVRSPVRVRQDGTGQCPGGAPTGFTPCSYPVRPISH